MSKNRKRQRFNKKIREIIEHADLDVEFYPKEMSTVEIEEFYLKIKNRVGTIDIGTKNNYGFSDYTPYNALNRTYRKGETK